MQSLTLIAAAMLISVNCIADTLDVCQSCPFNSARVAINAAKSGDLIRVMHATYPETLIVNKNIILQGGYSGPPTWQRDVKKYPTIIDAQGTGRVIYVPSGFSPVIDGFTITGGKAHFGAGIDIYYSSPTISHNIIRNNQAVCGGGICIYGESARPTFDSNQIIGNIAQDDGGGFYINDNSSPILFNNIIAKNKAVSDGAGIYIDWYSTPKIVNNTIVSNDNDGIFIYNKPSPTILNNIIANHASGVVAPYPGVGPNSMFDYNDVWSNASLNSYYNGIRCGEHDISDDPRFVNADSGDYHVQHNSVVIEKGTSDGAPSNDIDGDARPLNKRIDIGADETAFLVESPTIPSLIAPPPGEKGVTTKPVFLWNASSGAGPIKYRVQLNFADSCFSPPYGDTSGITEPMVQFGVELVKEMTIFWRVNASNEYGTSEWSPLWSFTTGPSAVSERGEAMPTEFRLNQNYPNPFNPSTAIRYALPKTVHVKLTIFDPLGKEIETLVSNTQMAGEYEIQWNPSHLTSGVYLYRLQAGKFVEMRKMVLLR